MTPIAKPAACVVLASAVNQNVGTVTVYGVVARSPDKRVVYPARICLDDVVSISAIQIVVVAAAIGKRVVSDAAESRAGIETGDQSAEINLQQHQKNNRQIRLALGENDG